MTLPRRLAALLALALVASAACGPAPTVTPSPSPSAQAATPTATPVASDAPFAPVAWPTEGTACGGTTATRLGRVEAPDAKTVVFTLCAPDGAFLARLANPLLGIVNAGDLARIAADPSAIRTVAGHGSYRVARWGTDNVELDRVGAATASSVAPTVILRWAADPAARSADLVAASVDGVDAPSSAGLDAAATNPALTPVPRPLLATAVLGFGRGAAFADAKVRRAFGSGIDTAGLAADAFPAGSIAASHLVPCEVPHGCAGGAFRPFNGPAATADLQAAKFNFNTTYPLTVPDAPIPGLPDPAGIAAAVHDQLAAHLGVTVRVSVIPAAQFRAAVDGGTITGLYLDGVVASVADPSAFYGPLLLAHPASTAAHRAAGAASKLVAGATLADPAQREAAYAAAANSLRDSVPMAPLDHPGAMTVFRSDVQGAVVSPLGDDPLGAMTAGDRGQTVFEQATEPGGGWCGPLAAADSYRLCGLVTDGLYGYPPGSLVPTPRLATACTPNGDATVWTCRLRAARSGSGLVLDAGDVVATFRALADPEDPVHKALGDAAFAGWDAIFGSASGAPPPAPPTPSPTVSASPSGSPSAPGSPAASGSAGPSPSGSPPAPSGSGG
jgi:ABC-type transport system substrate-binding protein